MCVSAHAPITHRTNDKSSLEFHSACGSQPLCDVTQGTFISVVPSGLCFLCTCKHLMASEKFLCPPPPALILITIFATVQHCWIAFRACPPCGGSAGFALVCKKYLMTRMSGELFSLFWAVPNICTKLESLCVSVAKVKLWMILTYGLK